MPPPWPPRSDDQVTHQVLGSDEAAQAQKGEMGYVVAEVPAALKAPESPVPEPIPRVVRHDTRFGQLLEKFRDCEIREGGKTQDVILDKFFEACELYRDMLSKLGRAASVVVGDIEHNLGKSKAVYLEAPEERKTLTAYLRLPASHVGIEKITWLLRGVEFFLTMIKLIFTPESGGNPAVEAYQQTLMQYHGWDGIVQSEGLVLGEASAEQRQALCERDAPPASAAGLDVVKWMIELMKIEGKWKPVACRMEGSSGFQVEVSKDASLSWASALKLAGEAVDVEDAEYRKPLDLVRQLARDRWHLSEDLIVLTSGGGTLSDHSRSEDVRGDVFFFLQKCLESEVDVVPARLDPADPTLAAFGGGEELDEVVGQRCVDVIDPAFEAFRGNIAEARARIAESRPGDATPARASDCEAVGEKSKTSRDASRPLSEYVRFETEEGMALLYDPSPLDKWIGKSYRWDSRRQCHVETSTGDVLSAEDSEDFQRYVQRHNERRQTGNQADELVKLVAAYNPAVEEGKKVYKPPVDKQRHGEVSITTQTAELRHRTDKTKKDAKKKKKGEKKEKKDKKDKKAKKNKLDAHNAGEMVKEKQQQDDTTAEPPIQEEVDWGSDVEDTVASLALRCEERVHVQRLAARAVLDNLTSHRSACSRSMSLLAQKSSRVQTKLSDSLEKVEVSMKALESVGLHAALQTQGRTTLADVMPRERIRRFTEALEAERAQLIQRLEKLQRQDSQLQALCDQVAERVEQLILEDSVGVEAKAILEEQGRAQRELLPELRALVPSAGAAPSTVLEDEKRSALVLDSVKTACANVRSSLDQLQSCWDRQHQTFVQRLREVAYVQSKVRYVERQAALLEEEVNAQSNNSQQLNRLQKMPRAYNSTLREVALRRQFRARYLAQCEKALTTLSRMVEVENSRNWSAGSFS
ncbi:hypothetical protein AK812_SmicGene29370 [Symbiodinium microadriaticum]|uniref:Uncharacterized protein n=1 Tax=Symbiodinium microadriaticum TaxID=2951 RepID=A0A1Q9D204_SYMMI|nr:hypothetical protein AK812_SmicGene29370 [Symbiodinium microadriaticum]